MTLIIDSEKTADWTKRGWDLPRYRSKRFMGYLQAIGMSLEQFRRLPIYRMAVNSGLIVDDKWAGHGRQSGAQGR